MENKLIIDGKEIKLSDETVKELKDKLGTDRGKVATVQHGELNSCSYMDDEEGVTLLSVFPEIDLLNRKANDDSEYGHITICGRNKPFKIKGKDGRVLLESKVNMELTFYNE